MKSNNPIILLMYDGRWTFEAPLHFYRSVWDEILTIAPALVPGTLYKTQVLLGPAFWVPLPKPMKRLAGRCVSHMERRGEIPLRRVGCRHKFPARYELR